MIDVIGREVRGAFGFYDVRLFFDGRLGRLNWI